MVKASFLSHQNNFTPQPNMAKDSLCSWPFGVRRGTGEKATVTARQRHKFSPCTFLKQAAGDLNSEPSFHHLQVLACIRNEVVVKIYSYPTDFTFCNDFERIKVNNSGMFCASFGLRLVPTGSIPTPAGRYRPGYRPAPVATDPATDPRRSVSAETESAGR